MAFLRPLMFVICLCVKILLKRQRACNRDWQVSKISLRPWTVFLKIVKQELDKCNGLESGYAMGLRIFVSIAWPAVRDFIGTVCLQGRRKTTSAAKAAKYLKEREKNLFSVVSADVFIVPAAIKQLEKHLLVKGGANFLSQRSRRRCQWQLLS